MIKKGDNHLHYGADGRIAKVGEYADASDARAVSYIYNALGQRVLKSDAWGAGQPATLQTLYAEDGIGSTVLGQYANQRSARRPERQHGNHLPAHGQRPHDHCGRDQWPPVCHPHRPPEHAPAPD